jgi:hypothetical protein
MDYQRVTAPCGIDCFNCGLYLASTNKELRNKVSKRLGIPFERAVCRGCRDENGTIAAIEMTEPCNVYKCITKKGLSFCFDCSDFPCDHLHPYADMASERPHNTKVFNLGLIKKMGVEQWALTKAKSVRDTYFKGKFRV